MCSLSSVPYLPSFSSSSSSAGRLNTMFPSPHLMPPLFVSSSFVADASSATSLSPPLFAVSSSLLPQPSFSPHSGATHPRSTYSSKHTFKYSATNLLPSTESVESSLLSPPPPPTNCPICAKIISRALMQMDSTVRLPPAKEGGSASNTSSFVTSESGLSMRVLKLPPMRDSSRLGKSGFGKDGTSSSFSCLSFVLLLSCCCCCAVFRFFFILRGGFGNTTVIAVSKGTHPG
mmetsp:Transcript_1192/g.1926  ORF Transcript_1192/g.1926 Transcript_1192/m.1926 type:complete len:232 (-) Transcript_1192:305-1000(-)